MPRSPILPTVRHRVRALGSERKLAHDQHQAHEHLGRRPGKGTCLLHREAGLHPEPRRAARRLRLAHRRQPRGPGRRPAAARTDQHPAAQTFKAALTADGIPFTQLAVDDIDAEVARLKALGVTFTQDVTDYGNVAVAVLDDTCGNLIQLAMAKDAGEE